MTFLFKSCFISSAILKNGGKNFKKAEGKKAMSLSHFLRWSLNLEFKFEEGETPGLLIIPSVSEFMCVCREGLKKSPAKQRKRCMP